MSISSGIARTMNLLSEAGAPSGRTMRAVCPCTNQTLSLTNKLVVNQALLNHPGFCFCDLAVGKFVGQKPLLVEALDLFQIRLDR